MRALWTGNISFGLLNVPVQLFPAIKEQDIHFHMLSPDGDCRLRRKLYCPETGKEFDFSDTSRGYEIAPNQYVIVEQEDLDALQPESERTFAISDFVESAEVDPIFFRSSYYLGPDEGADRSFTLLRKTLETAKLAGVGHFVMRQKEYLGLIRPYQDLLILDTMHFAEAVRSVDELPHPKNVSLKKEETALALKFVESTTTKFKPEKYKNEYREKVEELVEQKAKGKAVKRGKKGEPKKPTNVLDLTAALKKSLEQKRGAKGQKKRAA